MSHRTPGGSGTSRPARAVQLVVSCVLLGVGIGLLLRATLGSDGYSTLVNGIHRSTGIAFLVANTAVGVALVALAWVRGTLPGPGTIVQPVLVGLTVSSTMAVVGEPSLLAGRVVLALVAFPVLATGVAGYLGSGFGAGPAEAAALAWDPPVPFKWSYSAVQLGGSVVGWSLGADVGPGTVAVIVLLGPTVDLLQRRFALFAAPDGRVSDRG